MSSGVMIPPPMPMARHARSRSADILQPPVDHMFGERQYVVRDIGGHRWTFSQTMVDSNPADWGGDEVVLKSS